MINIHLSFQGHCRAAFEFYANLFGGKVTTIMTWADSPMAAQAPPGRDLQIIHATLEILGHSLLGDDMGQHEQQGFAITIEPPDTATAESWFAALAKDGTVSMPLQETFWAARYGVLRDRFGVPWEINCGKPQ
jgi:PhnB protein